MYYFSGGQCASPEPGRNWLNKRGYQEKTVVGVDDTVQSSFLGHIRHAVCEHSKATVLSSVGRGRHLSYSKAYFGLRNVLRGCRVSISNFPENGILKSSC